MSDLPNGSPSYGSNDMDRTGALADSRLGMTPAHCRDVDEVAVIVGVLAVLPNAGHPLHVRVVKSLLWVVTEHRPGFLHKLAGVRWRTVSAHDLVTKREPKTVRHEHVVERDWMARRLLDRPSVAAEALWEYPCALVTVQEHLRLTSSRAWGCHRYIETATEILDAETGQRADLPAMAEALDAAFRRLGLLDSGRGHAGIARP